MTGTSPTGSSRRSARVDAVERQHCERHPLGGEPLHEVRRLPQCVALRNGHDHERRARFLQQLISPLRAFAAEAQDGLPVVVRPGAVEEAEQAHRIARVGGVEPPQRFLTARLNRKRCAKATSCCSMAVAK